MNRGGHLLKTISLDTSSTNITTSAVSFDATGVGGSSGGGGAGVMVYNSGAVPLGLYGQADASGGRICTIPPDGACVYIPCYVPNGPLSLKALTETQDSGLVIVDIYG